MKWGRYSGLASLALALLAFAHPGMAGDAQRPLGVVELFTSQGCSSCPPADAILADLAQKGDVVALAYHVDYWDYLGWQDTLGSSENTQRQYDYMKSFGTRSVYTPQAVINGHAHVNGAHRSEVSQVLNDMKGAGTALKVDVDVSQSAESITIKTGAAREPVGEAHVLLVSYDAAQPVEITRGENAGKTVVYWNAVKSIQTAGIWRGKEAQFEMPVSDMAKKGANCAVLLQSTGKAGAPGTILGAAVIQLPGF
ncbi:MAG: DUF1223 domain-containing protein [Mesorhizobium sp.]|jgi:hypothetical protein